MHCLKYTRVLEDDEIHFHRCETNGNGVEGLTERCHEERERLNFLSRTVGSTGRDGYRPLNNYISDVFTC